MNDHLRKTFLAGMLSAIPIAVTAWLIWKVDQMTRDVTTILFGKPIPFLGIVIALFVIYLCGLVATSLLGKFFLGLVDKILSRVPILKTLYAAWKQILLTPGGGEGTFSRVVMIPDESGSSRVLGFCSGQPIDGDADTFCIFVPGTPNPVSGRLYFVRRERCVFLNVSNEDAFKLILSTGNYIPAEVGRASQLIPDAAMTSPATSRIDEL